MPWAVLLLQAVAQWRAAHGGALPSNNQERVAFKAALSARQRGFGQEENFKEALQQVHKLWAPAGVRGELRAVLDDPAAAAAADGCASSESSFWMLVAGLRAYLEGEGGGVLPLEGSLPDMTAYTEHYLALQQLYAARAAAEAAAVEVHVASALRRAGRAEDAVSREAVRHFCRNAAHLTVLRYAPLLPAQPPGQSVAQSAPRGTGLSRAFKAGGVEAAAAQLFALLTAADRFTASFGRAPGSGGGAEAEQDTGRLRSCCQQVLQDWGCAACSPDEQLTQEFVRAGGAELHCVAAIVGGVAAQEAIKLLTNQFVPLAGYLIYNGIAANSVVLDV